MSETKQFEWRGIRDLVYAELLTDNETELTYGEVKALSPIATLTRATENASEPHYYDDVPLIVVSSVGADTVTCSVAGIPLTVLAELTGQGYDEDLGVLIEGERTNKYFAIGYKAQKNNGEDVYVWRYKTQASIPDSSHNTKTAGTEANGQEIVFTGINTTHKFTKTGKSAKAINVDVALGKADVSNFFDTVATVDSLQVPTV